MSLQATLLHLTTENARLQAELAAALAQIAALQARVAALEQQKTPPPPGVKANTPPAALPDQAVGHGRIGVRLASLIVYLHSALRLPIRAIQAYLRTLHQCRLSTGGMVELLHRLRVATVGAVAGLRAEARGSPVAHMNETGWRENGDNGYIWELATGGAAPVRDYEYDPSRAGAVATRLLRGFRGVLVSDFYGGYNAYTGRHQRCWVRSACVERGTRRHRGGGHLGAGGAASR